MYRVSTYVMAVFLNRADRAARNRIRAHNAHWPRQGL
jgi:hypothetical protein